MKFSLIICTYMRPKPVSNLLDSVRSQTKFPNQIIIVDGSKNLKTKEILNNTFNKNLEYYLVKDEERGLTKQRNFGLEKASEDIVCFLDDDTILEPNYFEKLLHTYKKFPEAVGVGGYIIENINWKLTSVKSSASYKEYEFDGYVREFGYRNVIRRVFGLLSDKPPGVMPEFSNGLSTSFLPPSDKVYKVEYFMGGVSSFKKTLFDKIKFSEYFEGYGLYEDTDFCLRALKLGPLYVNTAAKLYHYHDVSGRPNQFDYGKMVIRNGWYVWRVKYQNPSLIARFKWNAIAFLLTLIRFTNVITSSKKTGAFTESIGRIVGWFSLLFNKPKISM